MCGSLLLNCMGVWTLEHKQRTAMSSFTKKKKFLVCSRNTFRDFLAPRFRGEGEEERPNCKNILRKKHLGLKHTLCKYINDAKGVVTLAKCCGQKGPIDQLEPTARSVWANLSSSLEIPNPVDYYWNDCISRTNKIKNNKLIDYWYDHSVTLLAGFQVIAFQNVSIHNTTTATLPQGVLKRAKVNSQYGSIK